MTTQITTEEFNKFKKLIYDAAGISMAISKKILISSRLLSRVQHFKCSSFEEYYQLITSGQHPKEFQHVVDLLTTNETYFFREIKHFDLLKNKILPEHGKRRFRLWSAASSSGEEAYSLAMLLSDQLGNNPWEIHATDISSRVVEQAKKGVYPIEAQDKIPEEYLIKYCLKGVRAQKGTLLIDKKLRLRVSFKQLNLNGAWPPDELFDVIFLRNIMIYFDTPTKKTLVNRLIRQLRPGGYLFIGHAESLNTVTNKLKTVQPSVYQKPI